jgi:hypothetical protein
MEEHGLKVFKNMVLRNVFGCMMEEEMGELHNEELCVFHSLPSIIQVIHLRIMGWTVG